MQYFCLENERKGTCYHEFYRGNWNEMDFWNPNSLLLHDDLLEKTELHKAFTAVIPAYNYFGATKVTSTDWFLICEYAKTHLNKAAQDALDEIDPWIKDVFEKEGLFTLLGI